MSGRREAVATYKGERTDRGPARLRQQAEKGAPGAHAGRLAAGGVGNTKDRDVPALEVRAGTPGFGAHSPGMLQG